MNSNSPLKQITLKPAENTGLDVSETIKKYGWALLKGGFKKSVAEAFFSKSLENYNRYYKEVKAKNKCPPYIASPPHDTAHLSIVDTIPNQKLAVHEMLKTPIKSVFDTILGEEEWVISLHESCIFKMDHAGSNTHHARKTIKYHQDIIVTALCSPAAIVWIPLCNCGISAPGMEILLANVGGPMKDFLHQQVNQEAIKHQMLIDQFGQECVVCPTFEPGDALFFNEFSIHRTHWTSAMMNTRLSLKYTAILKKDAIDQGRPFISI